MAVPAQLTADEKSRMVTLRIDRNTRVARFDGIQEIYYGDTLLVFLDGISGVDPADVQLWLWEKEAGLSVTDRLAFANTFAYVTGSTSRAYKEVSFDSTNLRDALAGTAVGDYVVCRLVIRKDNMVIVDMDVNVHANPELNVDPAPDPDDVTANPYVRRDHLRQWALDRLAEPLETQDDMAAMITAILTKLSDVTA